MKKTMIKRIVSTGIVMAMLMTILCSCGGGSSGAEVPPESVTGTSEVLEGTETEKGAEEKASEKEAPEETSEEAAPEDGAQKEGREEGAEKEAPEKEAPEEGTEKEAPAEGADDSTGQQDAEGGGQEDENTSAGADAGSSEDAAVELPPEGEYVLFAVENEGFLVDSEDMEMSSVLHFSEGGKGSMEADGETMDISSWDVADGSVSIVMADGGSASGPIHDGIIELDIMGDGSVIMYFAQEGADTSGYEVISLEEAIAKMAEGATGTDEASDQGPASRVNALWQSLNSEEGVHFNYRLNSDYLNSTQDFDVHAKGGNYYSSRTTHVAGAVDTTITVFKDGKAYNLSPDDMTGVLATETSSSIIAADAMLMDTLYSAIFAKAQEADYTEEERMVDGVSYTAEVFPAGEYKLEAVFCFDEEGSLKYYIEGAPVGESSIDIGESVYTVNTIDSKLDESLFDISAYAIK